MKFFGSEAIGRFDGQDGIPHASQFHFMFFVRADHQCQALLVESPPSGMRETLQFINEVGLIFNRIGQGGMPFTFGDVTEWCVREMTVNRKQVRGFAASAFSNDQDGGARSGEVLQQWFDFDHRQFRTLLSRPFSKRVAIQIEVGERKGWRVDKLLSRCGSRTVRIHRRMRTALLWRVVVHTILVEKFH